jgi:hypothetical protein
MLIFLEAVQLKVMSCFFGFLVYILFMYVLKALLVRACEYKYGACLTRFRPAQLLARYNARRFRNH